jgi:hypothetical protein
VQNNGSVGAIEGIARTAVRGGAAGGFRCIHRCVGRKKGDSGKSLVSPSLFLEKRGTVESLSFLQVCSWGKGGQWKVQYPNNSLKGVYYGYADHRYC